MSHASELIKTDIEAYLAEHERKDLLRFITCGSVDDGKSTLIGRLLHDSGMIFEDHLAAITRDSKRHGTTGEEPDLALLVDGLQSEREQGITIDVAYRYFSTATRKFIIADCPGHEQYTRNMATGASTAELAVILVDARKGVLTQTRRHSFICALLGIPRAIIAVNKMDLVDFDQEIFEKIREDYAEFVGDLGFQEVDFVPVSALTGDNVVRGSECMSWYNGKPLLELLETVPLKSRREDQVFRLPVQYVNRPNLDFRGFSGTVASGTVSPGDRIRVASSGKESTVERVVTYDGDLESASSPQAVTLTLADEIDISRGDMLVSANDDVAYGRSFEATLIWMTESDLKSGAGYLFKIGAKTIAGRITELVYETDVNTLEQRPVERVSLNGIVRCRVELSEPVVLDPYRQLPETGALIVIDRLSNGTYGAGMLENPLDDARLTGDGGGNIVWHKQKVDKQARAALKQQKPAVLWFTGLSGAGKSTLANALEQRLAAAGFHTYLLDGDNIRHGLNRDLDFTARGREENIRRIGEVGKLFVDAGLLVITAFISPFRTDRATVRDMLDSDEFVEIYVDTPLEICEERDPKGLYRRARAGEIKNFTGIDAPYEVPENPELALNGDSQVDQSIDQVIAYLQERGII